MVKSKWDFTGLWSQTISVQNHKTLIDMALAMPTTLERGTGRDTNLID